MSKKWAAQGSFSFGELRNKEVVSCTDGKRLGRIIDLVFGSLDGCIQGLVLPHSRKNIIFRNSEPIFIPWEFIEKIGEDVIMVKLSFESNFVGSKRPRNFESEFEEGVIAKRPSNKGETIIAKKSSDNVIAKKKKGKGDTLKPNCDEQCDKCMLFDCAYRWETDKSQSANIHSESDFDAYDEMENIEDNQY